MRALFPVLTLLAAAALAGESTRKSFPADFSGLDSVRARVHTKYGPMVFALTPRKTPQTVANFIELSDRKFFDGLLFHRVIPGFMAQGGDPKGDGTGGPGYTILDEFDSTLKHVPGALSMANAGPGTAGSQFFVVQVQQSHLDGIHTVYGQLREGWDVSCLIEQGDRIDSVRIERFAKKR